MIIAAAFCITTAVYVRRFPNVSAVRPFSAMMWLSALWALIYAANISVTEMNARIFLSTCIYLPTRLIPPTIIWLVFEYTGREKWITRRNIILVLIIPVVAIAASLTSWWHRLFRFDFYMEMVGDLTVLRYHHGIIYTISTYYGYVLNLLGLVFLIPSFRSRSLHLRNSVLLFLGIFLPTVVNILFSTKLNPIPGYNFAPTTLVITGVSYIWALLRYRLFGVAPIARTTVMENIADPVIVFDLDEQIVDFNRAAEVAFGLDPRLSVGSRIETLSAEKADFIRRYAGRDFVSEETEFKVGQRVRYFDLNISPIRDSRGHDVGRLFLLHDINDLKEAEATVSRLLKEKELLLKEVHHRIKNNMSTMASILSLHSETVTDPSAKNALQEAKGRIQSMMVLYGKLFLSPEGGSIDVEAYLSPLIDRIMQSLEGARAVRVEKRFDEFELDGQALFSLGILINELLTNAVKYAFPDTGAGTIRFSATREGDTAVVEVADNGVGIKDAVDIEAPEGFGLSLVQLLVKQMRGSIDLKRDAGTRFIVRFPIPACRSDQ